MKKKFTIILAFLTSALFCISAIADEPETDIFGHVITWTEDPGGEDMAGVDPVDSDPGTYSAEEQESIQSYMEEHSTEEDKREMGWLKVTFKEPDNWPGFNPMLVFYGDNGKRYQIVCYNSNGFIAKEQFPEGQYTVYRAFVDGDELGKSYPIKTDVITFDILPNDTTTVEIHKGTVEELKAETESISAGIQKSELESSESEKESVPTARNDNGKGIMVLIIVVAVMAGAFLFCMFVLPKIRKKEDI